MLKIKSAGKDYIYEHLAMETNVIDKRIKDEFSEFCIKYNIKKSKLIEEFFKIILLRFRENSLNKTNGYVTVNVLSASMKKSKKSN